MFQSIDIQEKIIAKDIALWMSDNSKTKQLCGYPWILEQWDKLVF